MTIDVTFGTVMTSIANLTITGVNVKDITTLPENPDLKLPVLFPNPDDPVSDIEPEFVTFGSNGSAKIDMKYTLNYLYLHTKLGSGGGLAAVLPGLLTNIALIMEKILASDTLSGAVDLKLAALPAIRVIEGPNGSQYHGCSFSFRVLEHTQ